MSVDGKHFYRFSYLKSDHWQNLRLEKLASVRGVCCRCKHESASNDVHHLNYRSLWDVTLMDLVVLCRDCHEKVHVTMDAARAALDGGADPREEWRLFLNVWGERPDQIVEVRKCLVEMRKRIESSKNPPWFSKRVPTRKYEESHQNSGVIQIKIPFQVEDYIRYKKMASKSSMSLPMWLESTLAKFLPPESDDMEIQKGKKIRGYKVQKKI